MKIGTTFFKMVFALPLLAMGGGGAATLRRMNRR